MSESDKFWEDLLAFIKAGRVVPVLGERAVTFGESDTLFYPHLAAKLAGRLRLDGDRLPPNSSLTDVACEWLFRGEKTSELYKEAYLACEEFNEETHRPGSALRAMASIPKFNLFVTTTFDSLLQRAVESARPAGPPAVCGFFPNKDAHDKDLPDRKSRLPGTAIYHLFGQASLIEGEYVLWEEDTLDFICALHATLSTGKGLELLARDLTDNALLVVGLNFSDLLVRLFLRVAKQSRLTELPLLETLTEHTPGFGQRGNVLFFGGVMKNVHVREQDPVAFACELADRWATFSKSARTPITAGRRAERMPKNAIFISYARENEPVVRLLAEALRDHGCVVWYDRERLEPGRSWANDLQHTVTRECAVFLSLVSSTTETAEAGYWRVERDWAIDRAPQYSPEAFYIPVWIDEVRPPFQREPAKARDLHAVALPTPGTDEFTRFAEWLKSLQIRRRDPDA